MTPFYDELKRHQITEEWDYKPALAEFHRWKDLFGDEFKLQVSEIAIAVDRLSFWRLGQFRYGHNGFGLRGEITISRRHVLANLRSEQWWKVLGTLLHELLHAWQQEHGKPGKGNYHNIEFRGKALRLGLIVDTRGRTQYAPKSLFLDLLERHGVQVPALEMPVRPENRLALGSKLRLWKCGCNFSVRVAVSKFRAQCLNCGQLFELQV